jgi:hypothetical protein
MIIATQEIDMHAVTVNPTMLLALGCRTKILTPHSLVRKPPSLLLNSSHNCADRLVVR